MPIVRRRNGDKRIGVVHALTARSRAPDGSPCPCLQPAGLSWGLFTQAVHRGHGALQLDRTRSRRKGARHGWHQRRILTGRLPAASRVTNSTSSSSGKLSTRISQGHRKDTIRAWWVTTAFAHGDTHDESGGASGHWDSTVPLVCTTPAAPPPAAAPPPNPRLSEPATEVPSRRVVPPPLPRGRPWPQCAAMWIFTMLPAVRERRSAYCAAAARSSLWEAANRMTGVMS